MNEQLQPVQRDSKIGEPSLFSFNGRIKRTKFWLIYIPIWLIGFVLWSAFDEADEANDASEFLLIIVVFISLLLVWVQFATYVKRLHDLDKDGLYALTGLIPLINLLLILYLGFAPGNTGANKYGKEPQ